MPHWLIKSALHHGVALLPRPHRCNEVLQVLARSLVLTPEQCAERLRECAQHLEALVRAGRPDVGGAHVLELGTGWYPVLPVGFYLSGVDRISTYDVVDLLRPRRVRRVLEYVVLLARDGRLAQVLPALRHDRVELVEQVLREARAGASPAQLLAPMGIELHCTDARRTGLPPASVDLVSSHVVLEYVPPDVLGEMLVEFHRVLRPDGAMVHRVSLRDQFAEFDARLHPLHFLRYSQRAWSALDTPLSRQNRLRISDYRRLHVAAGFEITYEVDDELPEEVWRAAPLAPCFQSCSTGDLAVVDAWIESRPAAAVAEAVSQVVAP